MDVKIGSAPDSWGVWFPQDNKQPPWQRVLDEIAEAGYEWTELGPYGYLPTDLSTLEIELSTRGLKASGTFAMGHLEDDAAWPNLEKQILGAGESLSYLGAQFLILIDDTYTNLWTGEATASNSLDNDDWKKLIDRVHHVTDLVRTRFDLQVVFHPHAETHVEYEDQIEFLLDQTDPDRVFFCLDTGHHAYRGGDPVEFLRRHHKRIPYLHLKSVEPKLQKKVADEKIPFAHAVGMDLFCEPSQGIVNFPALTQVLRDIDFNGYAIVEQDLYPAPFDKPLPIARRTREYLRSIGIG